MHPVNADGDSAAGTDHAQAHNHDRGYVVPIFDRSEFVLVVMCLSVNTLASIRFIFVHSCVYACPFLDDAV